MAIRNCARCNKIFNYLSGPPLCMKCKEEDEKDYKRVKKYLQEHKGASVYQVAEDLDVTVSKIKRFLREGRLEIMEDSNLILQCERCGTPIKSGQYCEKCICEMEKELKSAVQTAASNKNNTTTRGAKMRFLDKRTLDK